LSRQGATRSYAIWIQEVEMFRLDGRVAIVTGAASGIGAAVARRLAEAGADIVLGWFARDPHNVDQAVDAVEKAGRRACPVEVDVTLATEVERLVDSAREGLGRVDIMVANAGIARDVASEELTDDDWRLLTEVDLLGVFRCFRAAIRPMREAGFGRLLTTSSISGPVVGWPRHVHYAAAKAGLAGLVRSLALELGPYGITVNAVAPGVIETAQSLDPINSLGPDGVREFASRVPVARNGQPEDIACLFHYLASDEAAFVTGQVIVADGGATIAYG
jgi:3-oxoacyl-[acyl-carrier protein] reductase